MSKETFDFSEALKRMRKGKLVKRENGLYSFGIDEEGIFYHYVHHIFKEERMLSEDILATDREEVVRMKKKILTLTVSKQWFDKIVSGEKTEEYREIKPYWIKRMTTNCEVAYDVAAETYCGKVLYRPYTHVLFINGYRKDSPRIEKEIESITIGKPKKGLCPDKWLDKEFFVIKFE